MDRTATPAPSPIGRGLLHALVGVILAAILAACAVAPAATPIPTSTPPAPPTSAPTPTPGPTPTPTATPAADFPRTILDDEGTAVELASRPQRVISLAPSFTDIVIALGAADRLVGVSDFEDNPAAQGLPAVAGFSGVVIERVVELEPDLVLAGGNNLNPAADIARLRALGYPVLVTYPPTVDDVLGDIAQIGQALGEGDGAVRLTDQMSARIEEVRSAVAGLPRPRVFYEIGYGPDIYGPAPGSFIADMVTIAGGEPLTTTDPAVFLIPFERLVTLDPEVIVLGDAAYGTCPDEVAQRPGWSGMTAVREDAIRPVNDLIVTRPGPRLGEGLAALALAIHPQAPIAPPDGTPLCE